MVAVHQFPAQLAKHPIAVEIGLGEDAPAGPVASFKDFAGRAGFKQTVSCGESGKPRSQDRHRVASARTWRRARGSADDPGNESSGRGEQSSRAEHANEVAPGNPRSLLRLKEKGPMLRMTVEPVRLPH